MIKVLSIGNSFSQDAHRYLSAVAKNEGIEMRCVNLYIGGCSLDQHYLNMIEDKPEYMIELNGESTGIKTSIKQALMAEDENAWDYVTVQQVSSLSHLFETYVPYIEELTKYIRKYSPKSKILLHQTWAYEQGSARLHSELGFSDQYEMLDRIVKANEEAAELIEANGIIRSGEFMMRALDNGIKKVHRDTFHADLGIGRYLLALVWYRALSGKKAMKRFFGFDVEVSESEVNKVLFELLEDC